MSRAVKFLYLTQEQVIACGGLDMAQTMASVEKVFRLLDDGECIEPQAPIIKWNGSTGGASACTRPISAATCK